MVERPAVAGVSWQVRTLPDRYADSVRLMGIARALRGRDGIAACEVAMGTPANLAALADLGARADATPGDIVIAVDGDGGPAGDGARRGRADARAAARAAPARTGPAPRPPGRARSGRPSTASAARTSRSSRSPASTPRSRRTAR